jgi:hypothetical protein
VVSKVTWLPGRVFRWHTFGSLLSDSASVYL